jgi:hypothetical protein
MSRPAARLFLALTCATSLSACSSDPPGEPPTPPVEEPPSVPYDGPWTALPEHGEWKDPGPLAACSVPESSAACGDPSSFDLSRCDRGSLAGLERQGAIYRAEIRYEPRNPAESNSAAPAPGGFQFDASGQPLTVMGRPQADSRVNAESFRLSSYVARANGTSQYMLIGCQAPDPRTLTGCIASCTNGQLVSRGTFRAERMTWRANEPESSGLQRVSESFVERGFPVDVYVTRGHAYVVSVTSAGQPGGLTVFDVSNPSAPVQRASFSLPNDSYWNGVWAKDDALYIASNTGGVLVYDITTPASPTLVRKLNAGANVHTVFVEGNRLYAMSPSLRATLIFDVSNPLAPQSLSRYTHTHGPSWSYPHDAFAYGGRLYVNHTEAGFLVVDPEAASPTLLGRYTYGDAYSHANAVGTFNGRTVAFEGGERLGAHLRVLDVTNPAGIAKVGEYQLRGVTSIHNMVLVGTRLYIAHYHEGVRVLDVSDPTQPRELAHFNTFREADPNRTDGMFEGAIGIRVPGDGHVYVVDTSRGLLILNEP